MLREDELFVIEALSTSLTGSWRKGEDPPDAYLLREGTEIAVEISILTQHIMSESGSLIPRLSEDTGVIRLCDELDDELGADIPSGIYILLTLHSPIVKIRKFKELLKHQLALAIKSNEMIDKEIEINGNKVRVHIIKGERPSGKKILGIIANKNSSSNISDNARYILGQRLEEKTRKCAKVKHRPLWLALFNDYWLAEPGSYQKAIKESSVEHPFERIFLVDGGKHVHEIKQT